MKWIFCLSFLIAAASTATAEPLDQPIVCEGIAVINSETPGDESYIQVRNVDQPDNNLAVGERNYAVYDPQDFDWPTLINFKWVFEFPVSGRQEVQYKVHLTREVSNPDQDYVLHLSVDSQGDRGRKLHTVGHKLVALGVELDVNGSPIKVPTGAKNAFPPVYTYVGLPTNSFLKVECARQDQFKLRKAAYCLKSAVRNPDVKSRCDRLLEADAAFFFPADFVKNW